MNPSMKENLKSIYFIGYPIAIQSVLLTSMGFIDALMISQLGEHQLAAVGVGARWLFYISIFIYTLSAGTGIFLSQLNGADESSKYIDLVKLSTSTFFYVSLLLCGGLYAFDEKMIGLLTTSNQVASIATPYFHYVLFLVVLTSLSVSLDTAFRSLKYTKLPMNCFFIEVVINLFLNYCLIFGNFGFEAMGVAGAGLASVIARSMRCIILIIAINKKLNISFLSVLFIDFSSCKKLAKRFYNIMWPIFISSLVWPTGIFVMSILLARLGTEELAIMSFITPFEWIGIALVSGFQQGASVVIGNKLGEKKFKSASECADAALILSLVSGAIVGILAMLLGLIISNNLTVADSLKNQIINMLPVVALTILVKSYVGTQIQSVLKSGGDTKFCMYVDVVSQWLITIPIVFVSAYVLNLSLTWIYLIVLMEEIIKIIPVHLRIKRGDWNKNSLVHS